MENKQKYYGNLFVILSVAKLVVDIAEGKEAEGVLKQGVDENI